VENKISSLEEETGLLKDKKEIIKLTINEHINLINKKNSFEKENKEQAIKIKNYNSILKYTLYKYSKGLSKK
jgi:hypothetical protein